MKEEGIWGYLFVKAPHTKNFTLSTHSMVIESTCVAYLACSMYNEHAINPNYKRCITQLFLYQIGAFCFFVCFSEEVIIVPDTGEKIGNGK